MWALGRFAGLIPDHPRRPGWLAQVVDNRVFVVDGALASSAGIAARIALALHLIAQDCGESLAAAVPEDMVVYLRRSARDPEPSPFLVHRRHPHGAVHRVQDAIGAEPERDWNMAALAALGQVTERHLLRLFNDHAGMSPLHYLQAIGSSGRASRWSTAPASPMPLTPQGSGRTCTCAARGVGNGVDRREMRCAGMGVWRCVMRRV